MIMRGGLTGTQDGDAHPVGQEAERQYWGRFKIGQVSSPNSEPDSCQARTPDAENSCAPGRVIIK